MSGTDIKAWLLGAQEKYKFVRTLLEDFKSKSNDVSNRTAQTILLEMEAELGDFKSDDKEITSQLLVISALLKYEIGRAVYERQPRRAKEYFLNAWDIVKERQLDPDCITLTVCILQKLSALSIEWHSVIEANIYHGQAKMIWKMYDRDRHQYVVPLEDLFLDKGQQWKQHSNAIQNVLDSRLVYQQLYPDITVKFISRNIKYNYAHTTYESAIWASIELIKLSYDLMKSERFHLARHFLSCSSQMIVEHEKTLEKQSASSRTQDLNLLKGKLHCSWGKYATCLLVCSNNEQLLKVSGLNKGTSTKNDETQYLDDSVYLYQLFCEGKVEEFEKRVACSFASNYEEARELFLFGREQLNLFKRFYLSDKNIDEFVEIIMCSCSLYASLILFENDNQRKCQMHKRQIDMLEDTLKKLSIQSHSLHHQKLWCDLADNYYQMACLKICLLRNAEINHAIKRNKINFLANKAIEYCGIFLDCFKNADGQFPKVFPDNIAGQVLKTHLILSKLHRMLFIRMALDRYRNLQQSKTYYEFVVNYVEENPEQGRMIQNELDEFKKILEFRFDHLQDNDD